MRLQKKLHAGGVRRKLAVRQRVRNHPERPRLSIHRSTKHISAQVIDDIKGHTVASASSLEKAIRGAAGTKPEGKKASKSDLSRIVGEAVAKRALEKGVKAVVFDRGSFRYHGRVRALAEAARKAGLQF